MNVLADRWSGFISNMLPLWSWLGNDNKETIRSCFTGVVTWSPWVKRLSGWSECILLFCRKIRLIDSVHVLQHKGQLQVNHINPSLPFTMHRLPMSQRLMRYLLFYQTCREPVMAFGLHGRLETPKLVTVSENFSDTKWEKKSVTESNRGVSIWSNFSATWNLSLDHNSRNKVL